MKTKNILWVVPRVFLPISDGASKANDSLLRSVFPLNEKETAFKVTLLLFSENMKVNSDHFLTEFNISKVIVLKKKLLDKGIRRIFQVLANIFSKTPLTASFFDLKENSLKLQELGQEKFDIIIYDGPHPFSGLDSYFKGVPFVYRSHNVEFDLWNTHKAKFLIKRVLKEQKRKMKKLEENLLKKSRYVWTISDEDRKKYLEEFKDLKLEHKIKFVPLTQKFEKNLFFERAGADFLFVGKLDWEPNRLGLIWFLENVAPHLEEKIKINIVGKGIFPQEKFKKLKNVFFHGYVENLDSFYKESTASLIPIFSGSGTRIKVVEALGNGTPILSTTFGVSGSGLEEDDFFVADSPKEWIEFMNNWDSKEAFKMTLRARKSLEELYSEKRLENEFIGIL